MRHTLMNGLSLAVAKRKAWAIDAAWLQRAESMSWAALVQGFHSLPGLLEETDAALSQRADMPTLQSIVTRLGQVRTNTTGLYPEVSNPVTLDTASMQSLDPTSEEHVIMADADAFPELFAPMSKDGSADAFKIVLSSFLSLILECTILRIWHFRPETTATVTADAHQEVQQEAYHLARTLCKVSLSFTQTEKLADALTLRFCLTLARNVFEQQDRRPEMGWCHACLIANQLRALRIRHNSPSTPCKVEEITCGIAEAARYKSRFNPQAFSVGGAETPDMRLLAFSPRGADTAALEE